MHALLSNLLAALLLTHAVLGCCWHHGHRCADRPTAAASGACQAACRHDHCGDDEHQPATPCPATSQCAGICTFLPTSKTQVRPHLPVVPWEIASNASGYVTLPQHSLPPAARWICGLSDAAPPLRLHALHHLWLV
jgi:hypothetical protein